MNSLIYVLIGSMVIVSPAWASHFINCDIEARVVAVENIERLDGVTSYGARESDYEQILKIELVKVADKSRREPCPSEGAHVTLYVTQEQQGHYKTGDQLLLEYHNNGDARGSDITWSVIGEAGEGEDSAIAVVRQMKSDVLAASSFDDLSAYVPAERVKDMVDLPDEQKEAMLQQWKAQIGTVTPAEEQVKDDQAAVLAYDDGGRSAVMFQLRRDNDVWKIETVNPIEDAISGASGRFDVAGSFDASVESGHVRQMTFEGHSMFIIYDFFAEVFFDGRRSSPTLGVVFPNCLAKGTYHLMPDPPGWTTYTGPDADGDGNDEMFELSEDAMGQLEVESVEDGRFAGHFSFPAVDYQARTVQVTGIVKGVPAVCANE